MLVAIFVFGLLVGSFLNALIHRLHSGQSMLNDTSRCVHCDHKLSALDLIPLVSFLVLGRKCRYCKQTISWQYPVVELVTGIAFLLIFNFSARGGSVLSGQFWFQILFVSFLIVIFVYDLKHYLILDKVVYPAIIAAAGFQLLQGNIVNAAIGAASLGGFFFVLHAVSKGRWIGFGDVKLGLFLGVLTPWPHVIVTFFLAYFIGAFVALPLLLLKQKKLADKLPFGTFLTLAAFIAMIWGEGILDWYLRLIGVF